MSIQIVRTAIGAATLSLSMTPALAQQGGHQMAGIAQASGGGAAMCAQNSEGVTRAIDVVNGRMEDARQTNDAAKLRTAVADLQVVLAQMKTQLADCVALAGATGGVAMTNMPGMDHSKMPMAPGVPVTQPGSTVPAPGAQAAPMAGMDHSKMQTAPGTAPKPSASRAPVPSAKASAPSAGMDHSKMAGAPGAKTTRTEPPKMAGMDHSKMAGEKAAPAAAGTSSKAAQAAVVFTLRTQPAPPRSGKNDFEVTVKDPDGKPIADADVSMAFYMPPMSSMKMPEMRNTVKLTSAGNGIYKGSGTIGMAADWDVTVTASRNGQQLDAKKMKLTVK